MNNLLDETPYSPPAHRLGDWVESKLESMGITKEAYIEFKKEHGLPPNCNCEARRQFLNRLSDWWQSQNGETK